MAATGGYYKLLELSRSAQERGVNEVFLDRKEWTDLRHTAMRFTRFTMQIATTKNGCHSFQWDGIYFKFKFADQTDADRYVECLEAAGMI